MRFKYINIYSSYAGSSEKTKSLTRMFRNDSAHVSELYERLMKYYDNSCCKQLNIACDINSREYYVEDLSEGFPVVHIPFDLKIYKSLKGIEISRFWLKAISDTINYVGMLWGWNLDFFKSIPEKIEKLNFKNSYKYGKYVKASDSKRNAAIWVEQNLNSTSVYLIIFEGRKELRRILVKETEPPEFCYSKFLGNIVWTSGQDIRIISKFGSEVIFECAV